MTDTELIQSWLHDRTKNTLDGYDRDIKQFQKVIAKPLAEITLEDIQQFSTYLQRVGLRDSTRRRKLNAIKSLFTFATKRGHIPSNVAAAIRLPKVSRNVAGKTLKHDDVVKLIEAGRTERDRIFMLTMYATGARVSEVCAMKWQDFSEQSNGKIQVTIRGKGDKTRSVIVPVSVWKALQPLRGNEQLFPFTRQDAHDIVKEAANRAGLSSDISCHYFRHSHAHKAIQSGAKIQIVRDSMGHSSIAVTDVYLQSFPEEGSSDYLGL